MIAITIPPSRTSLADVVMLFAASLLFAGVWHLLRGQKVRLSEELAILAKRYSIPDFGDSDLSGDQMLTIQKYHRGLRAFIVSWLPFLVAGVGDTFCSLLRDAGYLIFPWPVLGVSLCFGLAFWMTDRIRLRSVSHLLLQRPNLRPQAPSAPPDS